MPTIEPFVHLDAVREGAWQLAARLVLEPGCGGQARPKLSLLELASDLANVSQVYKVMG
jgi:hypothetical protein